MKSIGTLAVAAALLLALIVDATAQCNPCVSAGVKLSHTFGDADGFTWGIEVSGAQWHLNNRSSGMLGWVASWDMTGARNRSRFHLGIQGGFVHSVFTAGLDAGPTMVFTEGAPAEVGLGVIPFVGALTIFPYYAFVIGTSDPLGEAGLLLKAPIVTDPINL